MLRQSIMFDELLVKLSINLILLVMLDNQMLFCLVDW